MALRVDADRAFPQQSGARRSIALLGTLAGMTLCASLVALATVDTDTGVHLTAGPGDAPPETTMAPSTTAAPTTSSAPSTTTTTTPRTTTTSSTTTTTLPTWRVVHDCREAEPDRPALLFVYFTTKTNPAWSYAEVREAIARAGGSTAHLDRLGEEDWTSLIPDFTSVPGGTAELVRVAAALDALALERNRLISTHIRCAGQNPDDLFVPDNLIIKVRRSVDVGVLRARHGGLETEVRRLPAFNKEAVFVVLRTSRPAHLLERVLAWWGDPDVIWVEYNGILRTDGEPGGPSDTWPTAT